MNSDAFLKPSSDVAEPREGVEAFLQSLLGNYTGQDWSDGHIQESVEWGESMPQDFLDFLSRQHDSAYAHWKDRPHREAADRYYNDNAQKLAGFFPHLAGNLVVYGNLVKESGLFSNVTTGFKQGGLAGALGGLIYTAAGNIVKENDMLDPKYLQKEKKDVIEYYQTDTQVSKFRPVPLKGGPETVQQKINKSGFKPADSTDKTNMSPSEQALKNTRLIAAQKKKFDNYAEKERKAKESQIRKENEVVPDWNMFGYQGRANSMKRKFRKKNKIIPVLH